MDSPIIVADTLAPGASMYHSISQKIYMRVKIKDNVSKQSLDSPYNNC